MHRLVNQALFGIYALAVLSVLAAALVSPAFRAAAYAPVRELLLPPPEPVRLTLHYSTEKEAWLEEVLPLFEAVRPTVDGRPIVVSLKKMGSREMVLAVLDGAETPDLISPASSLQIAILHDQSPLVFGQSIASPADTARCRSLLRTPLVVVAWKDRAEALWGPSPGDDLWQRLHAAAGDPQGWAVYGHPEWGYLKFGQTNPLTSNSGFQALLLMTYAYLGKTHGLTSADILSDAGYQKWLLDLQGTISEFGSSSGTYYGGDGGLWPQQVRPDRGL